MKKWEEQDYLKLEQKVDILMSGTYNLQRWDGLTLVYTKGNARIEVKQPAGTPEQTLSYESLMKMEVLGMYP